MRKPPKVSTPALSRRALLGAPAMLLLNASLPAYAAGESVDTTSASNSLVAYFTRSGNTRVIAGTIHRARKTDLFEIRPAKPYPEDYDQTVAQATVERDRGFEPPLAATVAGIARYEVIYLGFPIWGTTAPPVIRSFLRAHDLKGKTIRPFITHGGYGLGDSLAVLAAHAPGARIEAAFSMEADQEKRTLGQVNGWLQRLNGG
jgi:flavodoxin